MKWVQNIHLRKCPRAESMRIQIILSKHWMVWIITWWTMGPSFPKAQDPRTLHQYMAHLTILESMEWAHWWSPQWSSPIDAMHYILSTQKTEQYWVLILLHPYNACSSQKLAKIWLQSSRRSIRWREPKAHYQCSSDPHWNVNKTNDKWPKTWHTNLLTNKRTIPLQFGPPTPHFTFTQFISYLSAHSDTSHLLWYFLTFIDGIFTHLIFTSITTLKLSHLGRLNWGWWEEPIFLFIFQLHFYVIHVRGSCLLVLVFVLQALKSTNGFLWFYVYLSHGVFMLVLDDGLSLFMHESLKFDP